jgi:hypothetical protein
VALEWVYDPREHFPVQTPQVVLDRRGDACVLGEFFIFWYILLILVVLPLVDEVFGKNVLSEKCYKFRFLLFLFLG